MRIIPWFTLPLLALTLVSPVVRPAAAQSADQGLHPPGSAGDLVNDRGVPQAGDGPIPYVIVTTRALRPAFLELGRERIRNGIRSGVRSLESLQSAYPNATDEPDRIRQFLRDAYTVWGTRYVLLGGDSDVLPPRYVTTQSVLGERHFVSDWYFACLDGTWDEDHDGRYAELSEDQPDLVPELFVGRAPVSTPDEARRFVDKTIGYERRPADGFEDQTLIFANQLLPFVDLAFLAEHLVPMIVDDPAQQLTRLYETFDNAQWLPGALPESPASVIAALNRGSNVTIGYGAGNTVLMEAGSQSVPDHYLTVPDVLGLTNGDRAGHVWLNSSELAAFDTPTSLAEAFLKAEHGGAVTVIAASDLAFLTPSQFITTNLVHEAFDLGVATIGEALVHARAPLAAGYQGTEVLSFQLLGDPLLRVFSSSPVASATEGGAHGRTGINAATPDRGEGFDVERASHLTTAIPADRASSTGAPASGGARVTRLALAPVSPSPATVRARISLAVPAELEGARIRGTIVDLAGRAVREWADPPVAAGVAAWDWDLRDDRGERVRPGVYFLRVTAGGVSETRRVVVAGTR